MKRTPREAFDIEGAEEIKAGELEPGDLVLLQDSVQDEKGWTDFFLGRFIEHQRKFHHYFFRTCWSSGPEGREFGGPMYLHERSLKTTKILKLGRWKKK